MADESNSMLGWTTLAASFGFFLVQLDVTIVNVALPTIAGALNAHVAGLQWVVDAYALTFAAILLTGGYIGDRFGARRTYLAGIVIFAMASLACGLAADAAMLIAARVLQGIGAAAMLPCSLTLINQRRHEAIREAERLGFDDSGWWAGRAGSLIPMATGAIIDTCGFTLLGVLVTSATPYWQLVVPFVLIPCGMGLGVPAMTTAVLASVPRERSGTASAVLNAARQAAGAVGVAVFGALAGDDPGHIVAGLRGASLIAVIMLLGAIGLAVLTIGRRQAQRSSA
jgi:DHA2 family methylenomycin A resistance protein-like MFS transporter